MKTNLLLLLLSVHVLAATWKGTDMPTVTLRRLYKEPQFGKGLGTYDDSSFTYNYNAAYFPGTFGESKFVMAMRVQSLTPDHKTIFDVGPSSIAFTATETVFAENAPFNKWSRITDKDVIIGPDRPVQELGAEDPRIVQYNGKYYMYYSAVSRVVNSTDARSQLALATAPTDSDVRNASSWTQHGPLFPNRFWSKSGAVLILSETQQYLFFGDKNITIATSKNMMDYVDTNVALIQPRPDKFDSELVESGPEPLPLSDGNFLFLYNSARKTTLKSMKPGWDLEYNLGFVILDKKDPTKIIYRSNDPIMTPEYDWERCDDRTPQEYKNVGLTPNVIFVEGWKKIGVDRFLVIYQGCDAFTGFFVLEIVIPEQISWQTVLGLIGCVVGMCTLTSIIGLIYYFVHDRWLKKKGVDYSNF